MRGTIAVFLLLLSSFPSVLAALLAVDYGGEWTKASLVKPGIPLDVLLDKDSKRKFQSAVGWKRDERVFGGEAANAAIRFPQTYFPYIKPLLAATETPYRSIYPSPPVFDSDSDSLVFHHTAAPSHVRLPDSAEDSTRWSPEELLAHQLSYIKDLAGSAAGEEVRDLYLTVPSYFNQAQRRAMKDAAEVAGLNVVGIMTDAGAVGLNYAMTRSFPRKEVHMIYDSGAIKTTATLLAFYTAEIPAEVNSLSKIKKKIFKPKPVNTTVVEIIAAASEPSLGGINIDERLREVLVADVASKLDISPDEIRADHRAMRKLWREAQKVKAVLSANQEASASIESLINDQDYRSRFSRVQLEEICAFSDGFSKPIREVLAAADMTMEQIDSVILFGGNTRVPLVQAAVKSVTGSEKIAQNVNTDEAAVLGAAFYGASTGRAFASKIKLRLLEGLNRGIAYSSTLGKDVMFPIGTNSSTKTTLTFSAKEDFGIDFGYDESGGQIAEALLHVDVRGLNDAFYNLTEAEKAAAEVQLTMRLDSRGFLQAANAVLNIPGHVTDKGKGSLGDKLKGLFGGSKEESTTADTVDPIPTPSDQDVTSDPLVSEKDKRIALKFVETVLGTKPVSAIAKRQAKARLAEIHSVEAAVVAKAEARNLLEGFLYRLIGLLSPDSTNDAMRRHATKAEQDHLSTEAQAALEWMTGAGEQAGTAEFVTKRAELEALELPIIRRYQESQSRPKAIEDFQKAMMITRAFFVEAKKNLTEATERDEPSKYTNAELDDLLQLLKQNEAWMREKKPAQDAIEDDPTKDPILLTTDLDQKGKALQGLSLRLQNKRIPKAKPKPSSSVGSQASETITTENPARSEEPAAEPEAFASETDTPVTKPTTINQPYEEL